MHVRLKSYLFSKNCTFFRSEEVPFFFALKNVLSRPNYWEIVIAFSAKGNLLAKVHKGNCFTSTHRGISMKNRVSFWSSIIFPIYKMYKWMKTTFHYSNNCNKKFTNILIICYRCQILLFKDETYVTVMITKKLGVHYSHCLFHISGIPLLNLTQDFSWNGK